MVFVPGAAGAAGAAIASAADSSRQPPTSDAIVRLPSLNILNIPSG